MRSGLARLTYIGGVALLSIASAQAVQLIPGVAAPSATATVSGDSLGRDTPRGTAIGFLEICRTQDYRQAAAYLDLRSIPPARRAVEGPRLAMQLEQLLNSNMDFNPGALRQIPVSGAGIGERETVATFSSEGRKFPVELARVQLNPGSWVWQFSSTSVALIPQLHRLIAESALERNLPDVLVNWTLLDTALWQWVALVLLAVLLTAVSSLLSRGVLRLARPLLRRASTYLHTEVLEALAGPVRLLVIVAGFRAGLEVIGPTALLRLYLGRLLGLTLSAGIAWAVMRLIDVATDRARYVLATDHVGLSSSVLPLLNKIVKIVVLVFAITTILSNLGYNTTTVIAGVGVGGLVVALAAQKTIENLFGGVAVISDRPVLVGDLCRFGDKTGTVEAIGLRSVRIRTPDRTLVTVPNAQFSAMTLENLSRRDRIWFHPRLSLSRETSPRQIRQLLDSISRLLESSPAVDSGGRSVRFTAVGAYSLDLEISAYILTSDDDEFSRIQQDLLLQTLDAVESAGARLAIPTQANINYDPRVIAEATPVTRVPVPDAS